MLLCRCEGALSFVMVITVAIAGINLLVALRLMWLMMQHCHCSDTLVCVLCLHSSALVYVPKSIMSNVCVHVLASASLCQISCIKTF